MNSGFFCSVHGLYKINLASLQCNVLVITVFL